MTTLRALPFLAFAAALAAQAPSPTVDLNSLTSASARYTRDSMRGQQQPEVMDLRKLRGDNGGDPLTLMGKATDVQRWTIFYDIQYHVGARQAPPDPKSASVKCVKGVFGDYFTSLPPVAGCKSIENVWFTITLDGAVGQLNASGYRRGFSEVSVCWPDNVGFADEPVYVFTCPWERTRVAISTTTGALAWYQMF